ncbi:MAG: hypothetical protein GY803_22185 [Chloroflexi bacterium]|nr:hypothetical protein [Chloroflexota bacterium]
MKKTLHIALLLIIMLSLVVGAAQAQDNRGTIQGVVYEDVDGDGLCINTGVEGEGPVEGVDIEFVSSDEQTVIVHYTGPEGIYGLYAAGQSYWRVTANPSADWVVTSENPLYAPLSDDNRAVTHVDFCIQKANAANNSAAVILPESGATNNGLTAIAAFIGATFMMVGLALERRRRQVA